MVRARLTVPEIARSAMARALSGEKDWPTVFCACAATGEGVVEAGPPRAGVIPKVAQMHATQSVLEIRGRILITRPPDASVGQTARQARIATFILVRNRRHDYNQNDW